MGRAQRCSRMPGFYRLSVDERVRRVAAFAGLRDDERALLLRADALPLSRAERMIENVGGLLALPIGFAPNFRVDGEDRILPMAIEEPSVIAAASNAARLLRDGRGIETEATDPVMIGQIQLLDVADLDAAARALVAAADELVAQANAVRPSLVRRGGGARALEVRRFETTAVGPMLVVHLLVDVRDAMGANLVNGMVEAIAPRCAELAQGRACLRILSNLADRRLVRARGRVPVARLARPDLGLDGRAVARRIVEASAFAEVDPYRAATHNKGIMNGVDAVLVATGQDWRAVEAGAHAHAARGGRYAALATWRLEGDALVGVLEMPMQVGTAGGVVGSHPVVRVLLKVAGACTASALGRLAAAAGLAQNLAAILALATEGIQRGHMALHARNIAAAVGARDDQIDAVAAEMVRRNAIDEQSARRLVAEMCM